LKKPELDQAGNQIVNVESGNFGKAPRTDLDILFDNTTNNPGNYTFEKMFSGGYFGGLCLTTLKAAAMEGVLSAEAGERLNDIIDLTTGEANNFVTNPGSVDNILSDQLTDAQDRAAAAHIIDTLIDRAAVLVASNLAAVVLKAGKGTRPEQPILLTIEGTTFYKLHNFRVRFEKYFSEFLAGERKRYIEFTEVDQSSLIGAALAGLID
jgi:hexokinase